MIQTETMLDVADNSGARRVQWTGGSRFDGPPRPLGPGDIRVILGSWRARCPVFSR